MPLHLLLGLRTSLTPSAALQRRRTSPGMSLKYRHCSFGFQIGPSVNQKPVQSFSTPASLSINLSNSCDFTSTALMESFIPFSRLLNVQAHPAAGRARHLLSQISDFNFIFAQNYMLGVISCQTQITRAEVERNGDGWELKRGH